MKIVLKFSGKNINPNNVAFLLPVIEAWDNGTNIALVHGGGPQITNFLEKLGKKSTFVQGLRVTDAEDMDLTEMVLSGLLNKTLVGMFYKRGILACGISGRDAGLLVAKKHTVRIEGQPVDIGRVGDITQVNPQLVIALWANHILPVISPISIDSEGKSLNVNADWAAAHLAINLQAEKLLLFTDVPGVLADPSDPSSLIPTLPLVEIPQLIQKGIVSGGMVPKLQMVQKVLLGGVDEVFIAGGKSLGMLQQFFNGQLIPGTKMVR